MATKRNIKKQAPKLNPDIKTMSSILQSRMSLFNGLGQSFGGNRNLYDQCGYPKTLIYSDFENRYGRQDITRRIINAFPDATWASKPAIFETEDRQETKFEKEIDKFIKDSKLFHYLTRVDRLACLGQYAILLLGFDDGRPLDSPVERASELLYMQPYSQANATIHSYNTDPTDKRFGNPEFYSLNISVGDETKTWSQLVHYSRVIHVVVNASESDIFGVPMLESIFNRLQDLETITAGSTEMFWRGAFPGYALEAGEGADISGQTVTQIESEMSDYLNSLNRYMRLQGISVKTLSPQIVSPKDQLDAIITLICAAIGIPKRILLGTEEGKLAGNQDAVQWNERVSERRRLFANPFILEPLIDKMIDLNILPTPKNGEYIIEWEKVNSPTEIQIAETARVQSEALAKYVSSGSDVVISPNHYLTEILKMDEEKVEAIMKESMLLMDKQAEEDQAAMEEEDRRLEEERKKEIYDSK